MRKNLFPILTLAIMMFFGACSNEVILQETKPGINPEGRTLSITASMPEVPTTYVGLEQKDDKTIALTWEVDDELQLAFVQGENYANSIAEVKIISGDKKKATFDIKIPDGINQEVMFDLYGVYGGGELSGTIVSLPTNAGSATSLENVQTRKDVMLYFETKIDETNTNLSLSFGHLGSLFSITLKNTGTTSLENLSEAQLVGVDNSDNKNWAYNASNDAQSYDLVTGKFQNIASAGNQISFKAATNSLAAGATTTFWAWYPPLPEVNWPALKIELVKTDNSIVASANAMPTKTSPTAVAKSYYFYAAWDGTELNYTNEVFTNELTINVAEMGTLSTLLSPTQKAITKKLNVTGQINKADFDVMKNEMPDLNNLDLSQVTCENNKIPNSALHSKKSITTIVLPESITSIGSSAFQSCTGLKGNLILPDMITAIEDFAFYACKGFTGALVIPNKVITIGSSSFAYCSGFNDLTLSDELKSIGFRAFYECSEIAGTVIFPATLTSIGSGGFYRSYKITVYQFPHKTPITYTSDMLNNKKTIKVPEIAVGLYEAATGWGTRHEGLIVGY